MKDPRQDSGQKNFPYTRYSKKCFTQIYRDLYVNAMLVLLRMSSKKSFFNTHDKSLGRRVKAPSRKSFEIQAYSITKPNTLLKRKFE